MRLFLLSCLLGVVCVCGTVRAETAGVPIAPHRAVYTMVMGAAKSGSNIADVSGKLRFEWRDVCDGWAIQQHLQLHIAAGEGGEQTIASTELTWESKDGKRYTFNIHHITDGKETETYKGKAVQKPDGSVTATYILPKAKTVQFPVGTLFPSAHTELLIQNAQKNTQFFTLRVFDGADEAGVSDISAFIFAPRPADQEEGLSPDLQKNPLLSANSAPVHMAFFKTAAENEQPDYEMDLSLLPNGIARKIKIDYGDFSVIGTLTSVESLPAQNCSQP